MGTLTSYLSESVFARVAARARLRRWRMIGIAPRVARPSARSAPRPPEPPARMTAFPFMACNSFKLNVQTPFSSYLLREEKGGDESRIDGFTRQRFQFL